uniref:Uncharacterized protein n=1 Tax=Gopherus agassizii TaxID=38772 RepID=A0A452GRQ5_9SAUR
MACSVLPLQEPLQQWGEEVEDGAIYSITLQRVREKPAANGGPCPWLHLSAG